MQPGENHKLVFDPFDAPSAMVLAPERLFSLKGEVAIVTGGGGELGRHLAAGLGMAGASVLLTDMRADDLSRTAEVLREAGIAVETLEADLLDADTPNRIVQATLRHFSRIDVLVNCAGVNRREPIANATPDSFDWIVGVDLKAPYFIAQAAARVMASVGGGSIINIGSLNSAIGLENVSIYGAAKGGLSQLTKVMAVEWSHQGIRANCLAPGFMLTKLSAALWERDSSREWMLDRIPMKRPGRPRELVGMCLLLASEAGSYINGQTFYVEGGFLAGSRWMAE